MDTTQPGHVPLIILKTPIRVGNRWLALSGEDLNTDLFGYGYFTITNTDTTVIVQNVAYHHAIAVESEYTESSRYHRFYIVPEIGIVKEMHGGVWGPRQTELLYHFRYH